MSVGALLLSATLVIGQSNNLLNPPTQARLSVEDSEGSSVKNNTTDNDKAPGDVLWSEDFTGGFPAGWTKGGTTNAGADWMINSAPISAQYTTEDPVVSASGGNHMLYFSEIVVPTFTDHDAWFQTDAITLTGAASYTVKFDQKFRLCCAGAAALDVEISSDITFASGVTTYSARGATAINAQSGDDVLQQATYLNITDNWGGSTATIYMRFHWNLGASHYYWMVDDIEIIESLDNDMLTFEEYHGSQGVNYTRIPAAQIQPIDFALKASNVGGVDATNALLTANVNGGAAFTGTSATTTIPALAFGGLLANSSDSLFVTTQWTPTATPLNSPYTIDLVISSDSVDGNPVDNTFTFMPLEIDANIYASDDYSATPGNGGGYNDQVTPATEDFEAGNYFDIVANATLNYMSVTVGANAVAGSIFDLVLYDLTSGSFVQVDRSAAHIVAAGDIGTEITLQLMGAPMLTAGSTYFAAVHGWGATGSEFFYGTSGRSPDNSAPAGATSLIFYPSMSAPNTGENFYTTNTPMVRLDFSPLSVEDVTNNVKFNVFPNPSATGIFNINLDAETSNNANLTVTNVIGKTIINKTIAVAGKTVETISLADYSKGIYFLTIDNKTTKLIVE